MSDLYAIARDRSMQLASTARCHLAALDNSHINRALSSFDARPRLFIALALFIGAVNYLLFYVLLYQIYLRPRYFSPLRHLPGPGLQNAHWLFGHFPEVLRAEAGEAQHRWNIENPRKADEPNVIRSIGLFGGERLCFYSPTALKQIFGDYEIVKPRGPAKLLKLVLGSGLLSVEGDVHKRMRRAMNPAFATKYLSMQYEEYGEILHKMCVKLDEEIGDQNEGAVVEMFGEISRALLDVICLTAFGYKIDSINNPSEPMAQAYNGLLGKDNAFTTGTLAFIFAIPFGLGGHFLHTCTRHAPIAAPILDACRAVTRVRTFSAFAQFSRSLNSLHRIADELLEIKTAEAKALLGITDDGKKTSASASEKSTSTGGLTSETGKVDILSQIIKGAFSENPSYRMSSEEVQAHVLTFLGAGHETTASGVTWAIWLLAQHPEEQAKLRNECLELKAKCSAGLGERGLDSDRPTFNEVKNLPYMNAVVHESLRVRPSVPGTVRTPKKDKVIDGVLVPKGTLLVISSYSINVDPSIWGANSTSFSPQRWFSLPPNYDSTYSFNTFISGNHHCIGRTQALIEMKAVLYELLIRFRWEKKSQDQQVKGQTTITMNPKGGLEVKLFRLTDEEVKLFRLTDEEKKVAGGET